MGPDGDNRSPINRRRAPHPGGARRRCVDVTAARHLVTERGCHGAYRRPDRTGLPPSPRGRWPESSIRPRGRVRAAALESPITADSQDLRHGCSSAAVRDFEEGWATDASLSASAQASIGSSSKRPDAGSADGHGVLRRSHSLASMNADRADRPGQHVLEASLEEFPTVIGLVSGSGLAHSCTVRRRASWSCGRLRPCLCRRCHHVRAVRYPRSLDYAGFLSLRAPELASGRQPASARLGKDADEHK